jgi:hypothetical protein
MWSRNVNMLELGLLEIGNHVETVLLMLVFIHPTLSDFTELGGAAICISLSSKFN